MRRLQQAISEGGSTNDIEPLQMTHSGFDFINYRYLKVTGLL